MVTQTQAIERAKVAQKRTGKAYFVVRESYDYDDWGIVSVEAYQNGDGGTAIYDVNDIAAMVDSVGVERYA